MMKLKFLGAYRDLGLLILRIGLGLSFMVHGAPKIFGGPDVWAKLGGAVGTLGISFAPTLWGLLAALAEFAGGIALALGFYARPAALFLAITMGVAVNMHVAKGDGFREYSHALEALAVFLGLVFVGPGRFSIDGD